MKIKLDLDLCQGHGICVTEAPALFDLDDESNVARILIEEPGEEHRDALRLAAKYCPTFAIQIED